MDSTAAPLEYNRQPRGSLAWCEAGPAGSVVIRVPPVLKRPLGKVALLVTATGIIIATTIPLAGIAGIISRHLALLWVALIIGMPSVACLVITLWMGFRWTIIDAGPWGLRLQLKGLLFERTQVWPRPAIRDLRKDVSLKVIGLDGTPIGKIDVTTPAEERWVMEVLRQAMNLPPTGHK